VKDMSERSQRINKAISDSGLSYGELSKITGIPKSALQRYATGETEKVPSDRIELIAEATKVSAEYIMGWETEKPATIKDDGLDVDARLLLAIYDRLESGQRRELLKYAKYQESEQNQ